MFDNLTVDEISGHVLLQEDVGNQQHNGKIWDYNPTADTLSLFGSHDPARFGNVGLAATSPYNQDEEFSGIIDVSDIFGDPTMRYYLMTDQDHSTTNTAAHPINNLTVEGGQLLLVAQPVPVPAAAWLFGSALAGLVRMRRRPKA